MTNRPSPGRRLLLLALPLVLAFGVLGCSSDDGTRVANTIPEARITGGPLDGSEASYTARIFWTGWDYDGIINRFEYAVDPPTAFSLAELNSINTPEQANFPDLDVTVVPGPSFNEDTLRVEKVEDGITYTFDWVQTLEFSRSFEFQTPFADTSTNPQTGTRGPDPTFSGAHTVYVRAIDNESAYSQIDESTVNDIRISYTAKTITPQGEITRPDIERDVLVVGSSLTVCFDGVDPDSPEPAKKPSGYIYKLLNLFDIVPPTDHFRVGVPDILYSDHTEWGYDWVYQSADTACVTLFLDTPKQYVFGMRAVDQAGGVEPFLEFTRNATKMQAFPTAGFPTLQICESSLGCFNYAGIGRVYTAQVPVGRKLRFTWSGSAETYGGTIEGYSWGVDIPDLDREGPGSGWSGWGQILGNFTPIVFKSPGVHVLYVRCRDVSGGITLGTLILEVIDFPLDFETLLVDDSLDKVKPRDGENDQFWQDLVTNSGRFDDGQVVDVYSMHGQDDVGSINPLPLSLEDMSRYRLLIWDNFGEGYNGRSGLLSATSTGRSLGAYLGAGGKLWLSGRVTMAAMSVTGGGTGDFIYPKEMLPGTFPYDFLKLYSTRIDNDKGVDSKNNFKFAKPAAEQFPQLGDVIYPGGDVDPSKLNRVQAQLGAITHVDAIFDPIFASSVKGFTGKLDSLYVYGPVNTSSSYRNRLCGTRWHNPDPAREQGRVQWFGFQMYYLMNEQAQEIFDRSIDWFREEEPPPPPQ